MALRITPYGKTIYLSPILVPPANVLIHDRPRCRSSLDKQKITDQGFTVPLKVW